MWELMVGGHLAWQVGAEMVNVTPFGSISLIWARWVNHEAPTFINGLAFESSERPLGGRGQDQEIDRADGSLIRQSCGFLEAGK